MILRLCLALVFLVPCLRASCPDTPSYQKEIPGASGLQRCVNDDCFYCKPHHLIVMGDKEKTEKVAHRFVMCQSSDQWKDLADKTHSFTTISCVPRCSAATLTVKGVKDFDEQEIKPITTMDGSNSKTSCAHVFASVYVRGEAIYDELNCDRGDFWADTKLLENSMSVLPISVECFGAFLFLKHSCGGGEKDCEKPLLKEGVLTCPPDKRLFYKDKVYSELKIIGGKWYGEDESEAIEEVDRTLNTSPKCRSPSMPKDPVNACKKRESGCDQFTFANNKLTCPNQTLIIADGVRVDKALTRTVEGWKAEGSDTVIRHFGELPVKCKDRCSDDFRRKWGTTHLDDRDRKLRCSLKTMLKMVMKSSDTSFTSVSDLTCQKEKGWKDDKGKFVIEFAFTGAEFDITCVPIPCKEYYNCKKFNKNCDLPEVASLVKQDEKIIEERCAFEPDNSLMMMVIAVVVTVGVIGIASVIGCCVIRNAFKKKAKKDKRREKKEKKRRHKRNKKRRSSSTSTY